MIIQNYCFHLEYFGSAESKHQDSSLYIQRKFKDFFLKTERLDCSFVAF